MHIVTKVLVVFCAVLSVLLAALTVTYAANANRLVGESDDLQTKLALNSAALTSQQKAWGTTEANLRSRITEIENERSQLAARMIELQQSDRTEQSQMDEVRQARQLAESQVGQLAATVQTQTQLLQVLREESARLRAELLDGSRREIELVERITELENSNEVLTQNIRAIREQLQEARRSLASGGAPASGDGVGAAGPSGVLVSARVLNVSDAPSGEKLVVIDEGSSGGVRSGMEFDVVRGSLYIATIEIISVDSQTAVGRIKLTPSQSVSVQANDEAVSSIQ